MALLELEAAPVKRHNADSPPGSYRLIDTTIIHEELAKIHLIAPKGMLKPHELEDSEEYLDHKALKKSLSERNIPEDHFIGMLGLAMETECATDTYASEIEKVGKNHKADWLLDFNETIWKPDEATHRLPYKIILMHMGFSEEELDRRMKLAQQRAYTHLSGKTPIYVTGYATQQEKVTDYVHGLNRVALHDSNPIAAHNVGRIQGRENLHKQWYRTFTALQVLDSPSNISEVARSIVEFEMPDHEITPELGKNAELWQDELGADRERLLGELLDTLEQASGSRRNFGELILKIGAEANVKLAGPIGVKHMDYAFSHIGNSMYVMVGNAALEAAGVIKPEDSRNLPTRLITNWMKNRIQGYIKSRI